jgi:guanylate kinase
MTSVTPAPSTIPGNLYVIAAPSGAGKSSLVKALLELDSGLTLSVSHTTRPPRGQEKNGREYWFVEHQTFQEMIQREEFVEWANVHENCYGTSRHEIETRLKEGRDVILEIDWQGALQIRKIFPAAVLIFILPPSMDELRARLERRGEDSPQVIQTRLNNARIEMSKAKEFDFVIINSLFETALFDLKTVVHSQRLRYICQKHRYAEVFRQLEIS